MKSLLCVLRVLCVSQFLLATGCTTSSPKPKEYQAIATAVATLNPQTVPQPPITITTKYASACPYCGEINLSISTITSGGISTTNGVLQSWSINFRCRNCFMPYADYRQQLIPETRSVRLPIFGQ